MNSKKEIKKSNNQGKDLPIFSVPSVLEEFNEIESNKPDPVIKSFFEKAKKFWKKT